MISQNIWHFTLAAILALCVLCIDLAGAQPVYQKRAATINPSVSTSSQTSFCKAFAKACYRTALDGRREDVTLSYSCLRNDSSSYSHDCSRNGEDLTATVLEVVEPAFNMTLSQMLESIIEGDDDDLSLIYGEVVKTTQIVFGTSGFVHAFGIASGLDIGTLGHYDGLPYAQVYDNTSQNLMVECVAVRDGPFGVYQFANIEDTTMAFLQMVNGDQPVFQKGVANFGYLGYNPSTNCGDNGQWAGPITPTAQCETFLFQPGPVNWTLASADDPVLYSLASFWMNPSNTNPGNWTGNWAHYNNSQLMNIADKEAWADVNPEPIYLDLRWPFSS